MTKLRESSANPGGLHYLDLSSSNILPRDLVTLGTIIRQNGSTVEGMAPLISIDLSNNLICGVTLWGKGTFDDSGVAELFKSLISLGKINRMRKLNLSRNYLGSSLKILGSNMDNLTEIYLKNCMITKDLLELIREGLKNSKYLKIVDLSENPIGPNSDQIIVDFISDLRLNKINNLNLSSCELGSGCCSRILESMNNSSIETLGLSNNQIDDSCCEYFGNFIRNNQEIRYVDLSENLITKDGMNHISRGLLRNKSILVLSLQWNSICDIGLSHLNNCLNVNSSLRTLNILGNPISSKGIKNILNASTAFGKPLEFDVIKNSIRGGRRGGAKISTSRAPTRGKKKGTSEIGDNEPEEEFSEFNDLLDRAPV